MAQENNASQQLYDILVTRDLDPKALDNMGKPTVNPAEADLFSFNFVTKNKDYGTVVVLLNGDNDVEVFYGDNVGRAMDRDDRNEWYDFLGVIRHLAKRNLLTFSLNNMNQLKHHMKSMANVSESIFEGWKGTSKTSYNRQGPAKLVVKHSRAIGEGEARYRNIESLFVENADGERFKLPFKSISGGKAMARHVENGGTPYDAFGQYISETIAEINTLGKFIRASRSNAFATNEQALSIVEDAVKHYANLKRKAKKMISRSGYKEIFAAFDPMLGNENIEETVNKVREVFVNSTLDPRVEDALPILAKIKEDSMKETDMFEQWADRIVEGTWAVPDTDEAMAKLKELMSKPLKCGPDGDYATEQLYDIVGDDELFDDIYVLSQKDPNADCRELVEKRLEELGMEIGDADTNEDALTNGLSPEEEEDLDSEDMTEAESPMVMMTIPNVTPDMASKMERVAKEKGLEYSIQGNTVVVKGRRIDVTMFRTKMAIAQTNIPMVPIEKAKDKAEETTDIDSGNEVVKAQRDPMLETELDRLLQLARG